MGKHLSIKSIISVSDKTKLQSKSAKPEKSTEVNGEVFFTALGAAFESKWLEGK